MAKARYVTWSIMHTVLRDGCPIDHLRFDLMVLVCAEEGVVDEIAVVARDVGGLPDGIEELQIRLRYEPEGLATLLSMNRWRAQRRGGGGYPSEDLAATHTDHLDFLSLFSGGISLQASTQSSLQSFSKGNVRET